MVCPQSLIQWWDVTVQPLQYCTNGALSGLYKRSKKLRTHDGTDNLMTSSVTANSLFGLFCVMRTCLCCLYHILNAGPFVIFYHSLVLLLQSKSEYLFHCCLIQAALCTLSGSTLYSDSSVFQQAGALGLWCCFQSPAEICSRTDTQVPSASRL